MVKARVVDLFRRKCRMQHHSRQKQTFSQSVHAREIRGRPEGGALRWRKPSVVSTAPVGRGPSVASRHLPEWGRNLLWQFEFDFARNLFATKRRSVFPARDLSCLKEIP